MLESLILNHIKVIYLKNIKFNIGLIIVLISCFLLSSVTKAQDTTESLAFKNNRPHNNRIIFYRPDLSYQIWQHFKLIQKANSGDPLAEHELGLRYLFGEGFDADTAKAAKWIKKAADTKLAAACYNYGILLNNGWGVKWNPFSAFKYFKIAADAGMARAEQVIGLIYTDNLIVKRNWSIAYFWIKKAAEQKYKPAIDVLAEFKKTISVSSLDTTINAKQNKNIQNNSFNNSNNGINNSLNSSLGLVYIDFHTKTDSTAKITNRMLIEDLLHPGNEELAKAIGLKKFDDTTLTFNSKTLILLKEFAENGSPEALTLLGKLYEKGIYLPKDILTASIYYIRAMRLDSPRSPRLLYNLIKANEVYFNSLKKLVDQKNAKAMFSWYGLYILGFDNQFTGKDALNLLQNSASQNYIPALNELGLSYYTGNIVKQNKEKAISIWKNAEELGSSEARIRIATSKIFEHSDSTDKSVPIKLLRDAIKKGSVLAQAALAFCYQNGIGLNKSKPKAVQYYRFAAERGSRYAYNQLKNLYDAVRPADKIFSIN